jgi:hypothetical protein
VITAYVTRGHLGFYGFIELTPGMRRVNDKIKACSFPTASVPDSDGQQRAAIAVAELQR